ncbi:MAG: pyridoxal 5'-phosphate synthase glutaminase subunit PdxT [Actinomycetota bacterium]|nr:pyridoxal 5'-phosphate synthase glutaminase subunit PdxT [Actinomycetota bacterium]
MKKPIIGVLALQGAVREHLNLLEASGARGIAIKYPDELQLCSGLIIPGGESTTIGKLMRGCGLLDDLHRLVLQGMPLYGTCAGLIIMAERLVEGRQPLLGVMGITVRRNAFGRQVDSFEAEITVEGIEDECRPFRGVFIRAPWIEKTGPGVSELAVYDGRVVMARQNHLLATAFHPELTGDTRIHDYFIKMVRETVTVQET